MKDYHSNGTDHGSFWGGPFNTAYTVNGAWILQGGKPFRTALLVLAVLNMVAALVMIGNILYDAWAVRKWDFESKLQKYFGWLWKIHPAEMFPLIISGAVVIQSLVVLPVQSINTDPILFNGCGKVVQLVWPAIWIAPITMLVFGLETTFRSLRRNRFPTRNKWHIPTALAIIVALTVFMWAATNVFPTRGACLTGLIWWTARYFKLAIVVCSGLLFLYTTSTVLLTVQLIKTVNVEKAERIAATRVVYYLVVNTWLILLIIPYYIQIGTGTRAQMTAQVAELALNISGIINLVMHIFLRSNADRLAIRGAQTPWTDKRNMRVFGPSDLNIRDHISYPVLWQAGDHDNDSFIAKKLEKSTTNSTVHSDDGSYSPRGPLQHAVFPSPKSDQPSPSLKMSPVRQPTRNNSVYSIFPTMASAQQAHMSTSTIFSNVNEEYEAPLPPPPLFALKHDRTDSGESRQSSATVQIGLRLSYTNHALDPLEESPPLVMQTPSRSTDTSPNSTVRGPQLRRGSASSDAVNEHAMLPQQKYAKAVTIKRQSSFPSQAPQIRMPPQPAVPKLVTAAPAAAKVTNPPAAGNLETLTNATFQRPARKPAPSWRPQNWNMPKEHERLKKGSDKNLPQVPESAQLDVSPLEPHNPWKVQRPQVIQRPPGWV